MNQENTFQPGTLIFGKYQVVKCLGTGSMGMVYACRHLELAGRMVAMKVLFGNIAKQEVQVARFRNEIVSSYEVNHPNVVRAYEYFRDGDVVAFTMEFVSGGDLADRMNEGIFEVKDIVKYLIQMCSGVQAIHDCQIVHRDLKPENILLTESGDVKITDFGIARTGGGPRLTEHGGVVGTIDYVSPEYLEKGDVDSRSDIYALGVIAYEMVANEPPFQGKTPIETMTLRLKTNPQPLTSKREDCPEELSRIVMRALSKSPELRYQHAKDMLADLINFASLRGYTDIIMSSLGVSMQHNAEVFKEESKNLITEEQKKGLRGPHDTLRNEFGMVESSLLSSGARVGYTPSRGFRPSRANIEDYSVEKEELKAQHLDRDELNEKLSSGKLKVDLKVGEWSQPTLKAVDSPESLQEALNRKRKDSHNQFRNSNTIPSGVNVAVSYQNLSAQRLKSLNKDVVMKDRKKNLVTFILLLVFISASLSVGFLSYTILKERGYIGDIKVIIEKLNFDKFRGNRF